MPSAAAWVAMCQPSASSAIDPESHPAEISPTIMTVVSPTTNQVRRSLLMAGTQKHVIVRPLVDRMGVHGRFPRNAVDSANRI